MVPGSQRNETSRTLSKRAWQVLEGSFEHALRDPGDSKAREQMLLGAHLAGAAIENSMLGAAHALANGLTAVCGTVHGVAVGMMLPHVVRFNAAGDVGNPYSDLGAAEAVAARVEVNRALVAQCFFAHFTEVHAARLTAPFLLRQSE